MKNKFFAICVLGLILLSCRKTDTDIRPDSARSIYLQAEVENTVSTRAPFELLKPNQKNPLKAAVWASTSPYEFKNVPGADGSDESGNVVALHTTANFTNGTEQLLDDAVYPKEDGTSVYFVGMHPEDGWSTPAEADKEGKLATKIFDGSEDVMFAPKISGKYSENVETWPTFTFHHLLTWLRVTVKADGEAVADAWGRLKSLKVKSRNTVTVDLIEEYDPATCVSFSGEAELDFYKTGTDKVLLDKNDESTWLMLPDDKAEEVGYVLCSPVAATDQDPEETSKVVRTTEYTLIVETESRTVEVPVDLMKGGSTYFTGNTMRYEFIVNLNFKMGSNIAVTATVTDWVTGGLGSGVLDPNIQ